MMTAVLVIGGVIFLEARPVYQYLRGRLYGAEGAVDPTEMLIGFGLAALLCLAATFVPLHLAQRRLESLER